MSMMTMMTMSMTSMSMTMTAVVSMSMTSMSMVTMTIAVVVTITITKVIAGAWDTLPPCSSTGSSNVLSSVVHCPLTLSIIVASDNVVVSPLESRLVVTAGSNHGGHTGKKSKSQNSFHDCVSVNRSQMIPM